MDPLIVVISFALLVTAAILFAGIFSMGRGGKFDQEHDAQFMFARVIAQGAVVILLLIAIYLAKD